MKFYLLFLTTNINGSLVEKPLLVQETEQNIIKNEKFDDSKKAINCRITYKFLNYMFSLGAIIVAILYGCNEFFLGVTDYIDIMYFGTVLILNVALNWFTKSKNQPKEIKEEKKTNWSKKRAVCLLLNSLYLISLLSFHTLGYVLNIITDCNLFAGAEDCHSEFTLFQYITECIMFFIIFLKLFF